MPPGRRRAPAGGGSAVTTSYLWCDLTPCQARNGGGTVIRDYYAEGELVPGSPAQAYYYGPDRLGSTRRVFAAGQAPAYDYDPYGNALQATAPLTDFGYAGMFYNADSKQPPECWSNLASGTTRVIVHPGVYPASIVVGDHQLPSLAQKEKSSQLRQILI